ncbi:hypothetical protein XH97_34270 [Bradyrhizobium sp. CCBAU 53380]|nr:hypothetical protein [Bradyrhizobium sp. CCBAU 53380]
MRRFLFDARLEEEGSGRGEISEPHICQIVPFGQMDDEKHMDGGPGCIDIEVPNYPPLQTCEPISQRTQAGPKQHVLLKAVTAPTAVDHFLLKRPHVQLGDAAKHDIQALVRNGMCVGKNQTSQCLQRRSPPP